MCVCAYVCVFASLYMCVYKKVHVCSFVYTSIWLNVCTFVRTMRLCMYDGVHVCVARYTCVYFHEYMKRNVKLFNNTLHK